MNFKKKFRTFACPKLALKWSLGFVLKLTFFVVCIVLISNSAPRALVFGASVLLGIAFVCGEYLSIKKCGYGLSLFKCFIVSKIDETGISNCFCRIKYKDIASVGYEHIGANHINARRYIKGNFGMVILISRKKMKNSFGAYSVKDTICIPLTEKTKHVIEKINMQETGVGVS